MSILIAAAAAALLVPAGGVDAQERIAARMSADVLDSGLAGMWYRAFVAPDGTVEDCSVLWVAGEVEEGKTACSEIVGMKVEPAKGGDGQPAYGYYRGWLSLADNLSKVSPDVLPPDMTIEAKGLPGGHSARVEVTVAVGANGKVASCEGPQDALSRTACAQLQGESMALAKARDGKTVPYVYPMIVAFEPAAG